MSIVINDVSPRVHYVATSGQTVFQVPFEFIENDDLKVYVNEMLTVFAAPPQNAMQYSTSGANNTGGGTITFGPPGRKVNEEVVIFRDMPIERIADLPTSGVFPVEALNQNFDSTTAMIQQGEVNLQQRTLRMKPWDFTETLNALPTMIGRRGRLLAFDLNGQPILVKPGELGLIGDGGGGTPDDGVSYLGLIWTDDNPPPVPWRDGQLWWKSQTGQLMLYYQDVDTSQWIQINIGTGTLAQGPAIPNEGGRVATTQLNAGSGNWTKSAGCRFYRLRAVGGGGGGGTAASVLNTWAAGGGGGSGGFAETPWFEASGITGGTWVVGVGGLPGPDGATLGGVGGPTTWNDGVNTLTCLGGAPGYPSSGFTADYHRPGGWAGDVSGSYLIRAGEGGDLSVSSATQLYGGAGGSNPLGQGARSNYGGGPGYVVPGYNATVGYGGGGGGAVRGSTNPGFRIGGRGADGVIYVEELF